MFKLAEILKYVEVIIGNWLVTFRFWLDLGIGRPLSITSRDWAALLEIIKQEVARWDGIIAIFILLSRICRYILLHL